MGKTVRRGARLLLGAACMVAALWSPPAPAEADGLHLTDSAGRDIVLPERVDRVFAAGPPAAVLVLTIAPEKLVGWPTALSMGVQEFLPPQYAGMPRVGMLGGRGGTANAETVAALRPDLVLDSGSVDPAYISMAERIQRQTGIPYVVIDGRFAKTPELFRRVASVLGKPQRGEELAAFSERLLTGVAAKVAAIPEAERVSVYYARGPKGLETGFKGSINTEIIEFAGGINAGKDPKVSDLGNVTMEQVLEWDPDVIVAATPSLYQDILTQEAWQKLRAVRQRRVYCAPAVPFGWLDGPPGVNRVIGAPWLASKFYPDRFHYDLPALVKEYFKLFYGVQLSEVQLNGIMNQLK